MLADVSIRECVGATIANLERTGITGGFHEGIARRRMMMETDIKEALAAQGLDESDIAMNRAGRVSEKQIARQIQARKWGGSGVWIIAVFLVVGSVGIGVWDFLKSGNVGIVVFMLIFGFVFAAIPLGIYYAFRFAAPSKVAACKVTRIENAEVGAFLPAPYRGIYAISLNRRRYSGFASDLSRAHLGAHVNAYVVAEHRIVVALEPVD
ncbi:MAG: hypothetical protein WBP93_02590 [Pyrinomonadaceae bacterium]